jgi:aryl-alcohol dehydrogenase-like predicted oxidoreductase
VRTEAGLVPLRPLGSTGERVSMLGLGGAHVGRLADDRAGVDLVRAAIDMGVTFLDNAWEYHGGRSEEIMGKALADGYRSRAFLMTKHHGRDRVTADGHLEDSLRRLRTDVIDLWQFHEVIYQDDPDRIFASGGGIEAADRAKAAGKVRFVGFTGHKDPSILKRMLETGYAWDAVQMPLNVLDAHFRSFEKAVLPILVERGIGVLAMKTLAGGSLPGTGVVSVRDALSYVWSLPVSCLVSGMESTDMLETNVAIARSWRSMGEGRVQPLLERTRPLAAGGRLERYKTAGDFDGRFGRGLHGVR